MITNILLTVLILLIAGGMATTFLVFRRLSMAFNSFVTSPDGASPSPLANTVDIASSMVARAIIAQAKTTLMGMRSGMVRGATGAEVDMVQANASQSPLTSLLVALMGGGKGLRKNPQLLDLALGSIGGLVGQSQAANPDNGKPKFKL